MLRFARNDGEGRRGKAAPSVGFGQDKLTDPPSGCRFHPRCPDAFDECSRRKPERLALPTGHAVACHKYESER